MAWRTILIQNAAKLALAKRQLQISTDSGDFTLPLEDIAVLILESPQISLSSSLLAACQDHGLGVVPCGSTHMPNGRACRDRRVIIAQPCRTGSYDNVPLLWMTQAIMAQPCRTGIYDRFVGSAPNIGIIAQPCRTGSYDIHTILHYPASDHSTAVSDGKL